MSDIFISYAKADHALALKLSAFLEAEGWTVWWDKSLAAADLYRDEIMKQLAAARAVITIWTENSVKSDWVRAEAGRAKAEGKLIPVKTADVAYADIPLPFGEMHTENIASTDLIRAAIVAQLAKPAMPVSAFRQITSTFKYNVLTWIGIVGSAITVYAGLSVVLHLADWAQEVVAKWHDWTQMLWGWVFGLINYKPPKGLGLILSFVVFTCTLVVGLNLSERALGEKKSGGPQIQVIRKIGILIAGLLLYVITFWALIVIIAFTLEYISRLDDVAVVRTVAAVASLWTYGFPILYLLCFVKERSLLLINSLLFFVMIVCLLAAPMDQSILDEPMDFQVG
jgi:hypothetical protein